ncbi:MAG TPA: hypothetical protein VME86_12975 [Acidobacteriaceae bacterium]|nr:hypothetical protein [Acidobacteriaceae bacterium]
MNTSHQRRFLRVIATLAIVSAFLLFLFPHTGPHSAPPLWLALAPTLIFAILEIPSSQRLPIQTVRPTELRQPSLPARFQRPPPSA